MLANPTTPSPTRGGPTRARARWAPTLALHTSLALLAAFGATSGRALAQTAPAEPRAETEEEREARKIREAQERLRAVEEVFLRTQLEQQLNQIARWDAETGEILLKEGDLGGLEIPIELFLEEVAEPTGAGTRVRIKKDVKVRPFAVAIQAYMQAGGMKDIEAIQRGQQPFEAGIPDRVWRLTGDLLVALNAQDEERLKAEAESERQRRELQDQLADRLGIDRTTAELYGRILRETVRGAERRLQGASPEEAIERAREFAESPRGERLTRRVVESDAVIGTLDRAARSVDAFLESDAGKALEERFAEFLDSEDGHRLQSQVEGFLHSPEGQRMLERWSRIDELRRKRAEERAKGGEEGAAPRAEPGRERGGQGERQGERQRERRERRARPGTEPQPF